MSVDFFGNVTKNSSSAGSNPRVFYDLLCTNNSGAECLARVSSDTQTEKSVVQIHLRARRV